MNIKRASVLMSYHLRHDPQDLVMDKQGWVYTTALLKKLKISMEELEYIVAHNDKKRFGFSEDKIKIRAHQGHSAKLGLDIKFEEVQFPRTYYHGTARVNIISILNNGLSSKTRAYVHLSKDIETARNVGLRHSKDVVILSIDGNQMKRDKIKIFESENGVILVEWVPAKYIVINK